MASKLVITVLVLSMHYRPIMFQLGFGAYITMAMQLRSRGLDESAAGTQGVLVMSATKTLGSLILKSAAGIQALLNAAGSQGLLSIRVQLLLGGFLTMRVQVALRGLLTKRVNTRLVWVSKCQMPSIFLF